MVQAESAEIPATPGRSHERGMNSESPASGQVPEPLAARTGRAYRSSTAVCSIDTRPCLAVAAAAAAAVLVVVVAVADAVAYHGLVAQHKSREDSQPRAKNKTSLLSNAVCACAYALQ